MCAKGELPFEQTSEMGDPIVNVQGARMHGAEIQQSPESREALTQEAGEIQGASGRAGNEFSDE